METLLSRVAPGLGDQPDRADSQSRRSNGSAVARTLVVGAGGHGAEVLCYLSDLARAGWMGSFAGFLDDFKLAGDAYPDVLGRIEDFPLVDEPGGSVEFGYMVAVGQSRVRRHLVERIERRFGASLRAWTLIHPAAHVGSDVDIGGGTLLAPGSIATTRVRLGRHVIVNVKASVSHDAVVGDFATINPGATLCGNVTVGEGAFIGAGAIVKESVTIGEWSTIGAGAVVVRDIPPFTVAMGVPARVTRTLRGDR